jgi:hypothetical protein
LCAGLRILQKKLPGSGPGFQLSSGQNQLSLTGLEMVGASDVNWFTFVAPTTGQVNISMQTTSMRSLSPKVVLYTARLTSLASSSAANSYGATVTATANVTAGSVYLVKAMPANPGAGSAGAYSPQINFGSTAMSPLAIANTYVAAQPDLGGGAINQGKAITGAGDTTGTDSFGATHIQIGHHHPCPSLHLSHSHRGV